MTFAEKRTQIELTEKIGRILDAEGTSEERLKILEDLQHSRENELFFQKLLQDDQLVRECNRTDLPEASRQRFLDTIDLEFSKRQSARLSAGNWPRTIVRLAASLLLVAGTFAATSYWMQSRMDQAVSQLAAHMETERMLLEQTVQDALETRVSGDPIHIGQNGRSLDVLTPIKTYKSKSGHWCRQYVRKSTFDRLDMTILGTACRDENGVWTTVSAEPASQGATSNASGV